MAFKILQTFSRTFPWDNPRNFFFDFLQQLQLKGTETRDLWSEFPFALDFRIFLFNYTNADDIMQGAKPRVQQVGPFFYE